MERQSSTFNRKGYIVKTIYEQRDELIKYIDTTTNRLSLLHMDTYGDQHLPDKSGAITRHVIFEQKCFLFNMREALSHETNTDEEVFFLNMVVTMIAKILDYKL